MDEHYATVFSNQMGISARVCPRGVVALAVGHTCLTLRKEEFLHLVQLVRSVENHLLENTPLWQAEQKH
jgi:hypothetical protein